MSITKLYVTVIKPKLSGIPAVTQDLCSKGINLFSGLKPGTYNMGGIWKTNTGEVIKDSIALGSTGTNSYYYIQTANKYCPADSTEVSFFVNNLPPQISCAKGDTIELLLGEPYFQEQGSSLDATASDSCHEIKLFNDYNNSSTLNTQKFTQGTYNITWTAIDMAGNENSCVTELIVKPFQIPNFFSPNGNSFNETWDFIIVIPTRMP